MPQKSIGSFFTKKTKEENPCVKSNKENDSGTVPKVTASSKIDDSSPVKAPKKSKKRRIDSDDEDDEVEDIRPSVKKSIVSSPEVEKKQEDKKETDTTDSNESSPSTSQPPKRKTARKSVIGPKKVNKSSPEAKTKNEDENVNSSMTAENDDDSVKEEPLADKNDVDMKEETKESVEKESSPSKKSPTPSPVKKESPKMKEKKKSSQGMNSFFTKKPAASKSSKDDASSSVVKPENYNPSKTNYHPINDACWSHGEKVPYLALAKTFEEIEAISARLKLTSILCNFLRSVIVLSPDELLPCIYLCLNKLAPAYEGVELGIGEHLLMKAVCQVTGKNIKEIKAQVGEKGDLGIVAESCKSNQRVMFAPPPLTVTNVFKRLKEIAMMMGHACMGKKQEKIQGMFVACKHSEARYLIRSLGGKLRIGLAEQSVLNALGNAVVLTPPAQEFPPEILNVSSNISESLKKEMADAALAIKTAYCELPTYNVIVKNLLETGWEKLPETCHITPGIPLKPMLAHPTKGIGEVLKRFDNAEFTCEYKYDGERAQIHLLESGQVNIYSRNQENNTTKYPDIIARMPKVIEGHVKSCILDTESVAWDTEKKQILPFQVLTTRKRKDVDSKDIKVQVCVYAFDILYLNGESLVRKPFRERRELMKAAFKEVEGEFVFATSKTSGDTDEISQFLEESIQGNCEGLMVKTLDTDATYEIAKRSHNWLKLKKDYLEGVGDTLDLVVIGGYLGTGKRTGKYGGFLLACYDEENEEYQSICKTGTGFTDEQLTKHYEFLKDQVIDKPRSYYNCGDIPSPDHWFNAVQVWEIRAADLSISPVYKAGVGIVDPDKGISLRFPRFLRIRDDKKPDEATNSNQVAEFYNSQQQIQNANEDKSKGDTEEAFY